MSEDGQADRDYWNAKTWDEEEMAEDNDENIVLDEELDDETLRDENG